MILFDWILKNYIEIAGTLISFAYLYCSIKQKILLWHFGILSSILYIIVFFNAKLYADSGLQFYYLFVSFYGWYYWKTGKNKQDTKPIRTTNIKTTFYLVSANILIFIILGLILDEYTDSQVPYADALITSSSIIATWMLARKHLENWLVWIVVDALSLGLFLYKGLYPTAVLFVVYTIMSFVGYYTWKKDLLIPQHVTNQKNQ